MIAVVIPTITGREALHRRTVAAYQRHPDVITITVRNRPTIGQAWNDGAAAALEVEEVRYLHLSADDVEPHDGWADAAIDAMGEQVYPSPRILNADGTLHSCGTMGGGMLLGECATGTACASSPFPFLRAGDWRGEMHHPIGPSLPIQYYADDYLGWRARMSGLRVAVVRDYCFTHLEGTVGRPRSVMRSAQDRASFLAAISVDSPAAAEVVS